MVTRASLHYTRDYLTPGICSLFNLAAVEKLMSFRATIHTVMLNDIQHTPFLQVLLTMW